MIPADTPLATTGAINEFDSAPDGREDECCYVLLSAVSYVMKEATKVLLGASAMLNNGALVSRVGSALVAMTASKIAIIIHGFVT